MLNFEYQGLRKVISGGQTGVDQAGLVAARLFDLDTGGLCPLNWKTNRGPNPLLAVFGLTCTSEPNYKVRTHMNVANADATLIITRNEDTPGTRCTISGCEKHGKPFYLFLVNDDMSEELLEIVRDKVVEFIKKHHVTVLNIAGNRDMGHFTYVYDFALEFLHGVFSSLDSMDLLSYP